MPLFELPNCPCPLARSCDSPRMQATGKGVLPVLFLAEAPGREEDAKGTQLVGEAGRLLRSVLSGLGVSLDDARKINAVNCRPPNNRTPKPKEIADCRENVTAEIHHSRPKVIVALGGTALESLFGHRWHEKGKGLSISAWRGHAIPDYQSRAWVVPTFHPSYLLRIGQEESHVLTWKNDLRKALSLTDMPLPLYAEPKVLMLRDDHVQGEIDRIIKTCKGYSAFDFETTGIKPHAEGHRIVCCAIADTPEKAIVFEVNDTTAPALRDFLRSDVKKIAANAKFEETWSVVRLKTKPRRIKWDTVIAAHVLDNRKGITSVKFQAAVRLGVFDYSSEIEKFIKATDADNGNAHNRIDKCDLAKLMRYCGLDAIYEHRIALQQMKEITA